MADSQEDNWFFLVEQIEMTPIETKMVSLNSWFVFVPINLLLRHWKMQGIFCDNHTKKYLYILLTLIPVLIPKKSEKEEQKSKRKSLIEEKEVKCHVSCVLCPVSHVTWYLSPMPTNIATDPPPANQAWARITFCILRRERKTPQKNPFLRDGNRKHKKLFP